MREFQGHLLYLELFETEGWHVKETLFGVSSGTGQEMGMESLSLWMMVLEFLCLVHTHPVYLGTEDRGL